MSVNLAQHRRISRRAALAGLLGGAIPTAAFAAGVVDPLLRPALMTPRAARAMLLAVAPVGDRRLAAAGEHGVIVYSDDAGKTWAQAAVPVSVALTALHFPTAQKGWAVGHDGVILHSADGGATWRKQFDGHDANRLTLADAAARIAALKAAADPADAAATEEDAAIIADDARAGAEFGPSRPLLGVWFRDERQGCAVGSYGQIFHTRDGGTSWRSLATRINNPEGFHYSAIIPTPDGGLLLAGEGGRVCRSADDGETWSVATASAQTHLYGAAAVSGGGLLVFGFGGRAFRSDDGAAWTQVPVPTGRTLVAAAALRDGALALVDAGGGVSVSRDGGRSFALVRPSSLIPAAGVAALSPDALHLAGVGGVRAVPLKS